MSRTNPRANINYDIPKEWVDNFKKGLCPVCGKTKFEFDPGMRVYCSKKCKVEYSKRICTWQEVVHKILTERGYKCVKCGKTRDQLSLEKETFKIEGKKKFIESHPEILEHERKEIMDQCEALYQKAINLKPEDIYISKYEYVELPELSPYYDSMEVDHIKAVCNGGDQWDEKNMQVLCYTCHKEKTANDIKLKTENKRK